MIVITKGTNNTLALTLKEKSTLTSPYYLFKLTNDTTRQVKRFIVPELSNAYVDRYNKFTLTETSGTEILTSGTVTLAPTGFWTYEIFEQTSSSNLVEQNSTNVVPVEIGKVKVIGTDTTYQEYDSQDKTYVAYGTGT